MSSPKINNVIMVGCFIMYVQVMTTAYDLKFADEARGHYSCMTRVWLMSIGFTTLFGAMFSKTYRVYVIFKDSQFKTKMIKDFHLFGMIGAFLLIDCLVLCPWTILDPLRNERHVILSKDSSDQNVIVSRIHLHCYKEHQGYWFAAIYSYKGLLLAFGAFLAWETRKVKVPALNDSAYIGACIYNVVVICIFSVPLAHMLPIERANLSFILSSCLILFCTTLCQCILFVPKIQARNQVHGRFLTTETASHDMSRTAIGSTAFTATSQVMVSSAPSASHVEYESKELEELKADNSELRMQIENDSAALAKLKKELLEVTGNVQLYKGGNGHVVFTEITEDIPEKPPTANGLSSHSSDI